MGGMNTYAYVGSNPLVHIDPKGLVTWKGTQITLSASEGYGATRFSFTLESDCVNGKKEIVEVIAGGPALSGGAPLSGTYSRDVTFVDNKKSVDGWVFIGPAFFSYVSYALGPAGASYQFIQLGDAESLGGGFQQGWDASGAVGGGVSTVHDLKRIDCECGQ